MIIKTITDDLGKTKLSINSGLKGLFSGDFFKQTSILSDSDIAALKAYNAEIERGVSPTTAINRTMQDASKTAVNMAKAANGAAVNIEAIGTTSKAATVATKALAIAGNMIAMWAISEVIQLIYSCATATDRLKESAEKLGSQFSSTKSDIEDYKSQIKDLYDTINDSTSSYEDTYNARQNLLTLQNEMIEKFGSEAESVSLVTAAINGQIDALDRLTEKEWQETVNEFNNDPDRSITDKIGDSWNSLLNGGATKLEQVCNEMESAEISFRIMPTNDETYKEFSEKVQEIFGASLTKSKQDDIYHLEDSLILTGNLEDAYNSGDIYTLSGNLEDIYEQLLNIQSLAADMGIDDSYLDDLDGLVDQATKAKSKLDQYNEIYSQHILYDKILQDTESLNSAGETYEEVFNKINDAYTEFYNASLSGDEDAVESAKQNFAEILQSATDGIDDQGVIDYFNSMYPELQEAVGTWNFEVKFNAAINDEDDNFENDVKNIFSQFATSDDILNYTLGTATDDQITAYAQLNELIDDYGLTITQFVNKAEEMGLIVSQAKKDLLGKLVPDSNLTPSFGSTFSNIVMRSMGIDSDQITEWVQSLTEEEAKLANSDEFEQALDEQKEKLNGAALSAEDYESALQIVKDAQENLTATAIDFDSDSFLESVSAIQSEYESLLNAQEEFNEYGAISASTLKELMDNDLIQYLQYTADGLSVNTTSLEDNEQALKDAATAELYNAMCNDIQNLSLEDTSVLSTIAQNAIANLDSAATTAGENAAIAAQGWWEYSASIQSIPGVSDLTGENYEKAEAIVSQYKNIANSINSISIGRTNSSNKSSGSSSSSSSTEKTLEEIQSEWKEYLEKYLDLYDAELDAGLTDFNTYLNKSRTLLEEYYRDGKISAADYWDYLGDLYDKQLTIYDKVISAVTRRYETEIDKINDVIAGIEEQNDLLQTQLDNYDSILSVIDSVYEAEIDRIKAEQDTIQDTIDALQDENDERELALKLEQAKYDLYKAQTQRTKKVFNGTEFVYETDRDSISDAQENLAELTLEQTTNELEAEKDALDSVIEELEYYQSLWSEISDAYETEINKQLAIELWGQNYESIILSSRLSDIENFKNNYVSIQKQINDNENLIKSYEEKVSYYEDLKQQWSDITDAYEQAQEDQYAAMILGQNWEADVLNGRLDTLTNFKNQYISLQQAMADAAWNSANEQIKAAQEAEKAAKGSTGSSGSVGTTTTTSTTSASSQRYATYKHISSGFSSNGQAQSQIGPLGGDGVVQYAGKWYVYKKINTYDSSGLAAAHITYDRANGIIKAYAKGTTNAKKGLNLVGEEGTEAYIDNDGNISLVTSPTLIPMEGGETVKNASETKSLLSPDHFIHMIQPDIHLPSYCGIPARNETTPVVQNITLTLPNVTNTSGYERIQKELKQMQIDAYQNAYRR